MPVRREIHCCYPCILVHTPFTPTPHHHHTACQPSCRGTVPGPCAGLERQGGVPAHASTGYVRTCPARARHCNPRCICMLRCLAGKANPPPYIIIIECALVCAIFVCAGGSSAARRPKTKGNTGLKGQVRESHGMGPRVNCDYQRTRSDLHASFSCACVRPALQVCPWHQLCASVVSVLDSCAGRVHRPVRGCEVRGMRGAGLCCKGCMPCMPVLDCTV